MQKYKHSFDVPSQRLFTLGSRWSSLCFIAQSMIRSVVSSDTKVYSLASGPCLPHFVNDTEKNSSSKKAGRYLELIQDFQFPVSSTKVAVSSDGKYIGAIGVYPPELKVYDTAELSVKFSRRFDCEIVDFLFLSEDYKKIVLLHANRTVEFHAQGGRHYQLRVPFVARSLTYLKHTAELLIVGSSNQILRLDLEGGIFETPIETLCDFISCCVACPSLPLVFVGGCPSIVQAYDTRTWTHVKTLHLPLICDDASVTAMDITPNGLFICVGTSDGVCRVYDIRSANPIAQYDHRNGLPIVSAKFTSQCESFQCSVDADLTLVSADTKTVKLWRLCPNMATESQKKIRLVASIDAKIFYDEAKSEKERQAGAINSVALYPGSGLVFVAQDNPRIGVYFIGDLGLAPKWCSFLDLLTEELEENPEDHVYEDFQFVTKDMLQLIGAQHMIGTPFLRPYMHGYFMDGRLYEKLVTASQYEKMEDLRKKRIEERLARKHTMRLPTRRDARPVNKELATRLEKNASTKGKLAGAAKALLTDDRFSELFTNPNFVVENIDLRHTSIDDVRNKIPLELRRQHTNLYE